MPELIFNTVKDYPMFITINVYRNGLSVSHEPRKKKPLSARQRRKAALETHRIEQLSISRTRQTIEDICLCNKFEWFCTFTFDPKRYDNANFGSACRYMTKWLHNAKDRHSPNLQYLVIPEQHKSGHWHFHALLSHFEGQMKDSKHCQHSRPIFNIKNWMFGFSTAVRIDDEGQEAVSRYIRKYITKDMLSGQFKRAMGKRRFFASTGLVRPEKIVDDDLGWLRANIPHRFFATSDFECYTISKAELESNNLPTSLSELRALPLTGNVCCQNHNTQLTEVELTKSI